MCLYAYVREYAHVITYIICVHMYILHYPAYLTLILFITVTKNGNNVCAAPTCAKHQQQQESDCQVMLARNTHIHTEI